MNVKKYGDDNRGNHHEDELNQEETLDEPVMDGAEDHSEGDVDPRKGMKDPALIRDIDHHKRTLNPYG